MPRISSAGGLVLGVSSVIADVPTGRWTPSGPALVGRPPPRSFLWPSRTLPRAPRGGGEPGDHVRDGHLEVLLGAGHQAGRRRLDGKVLVHVDPDPEESRLAGRLEDAVTGLAGDLEDDVGLVQRDERLGERLAACLVVERLYEVALGHVGHKDLDVWVDRLGAELIALDVADAGPAEGDAADGTDDAVLAQRRGDHAGQVARLVFLVGQGDVIRQQRLGVALAAEGRVEGTGLVDADRRLVDADERDVRVL